MLKASEIRVRILFKCDKESCSSTRYHLHQILADEGLRQFKRYATSRVSGNCVSANRQCLLSPLTAWTPANVGMGTLGRYDTLTEVWVTLGMRASGVSAMSGDEAWVRERLFLV